MHTIMTTGPKLSDHLCVLTWRFIVEGILYTTATINHTEVRKKKKSGHVLFFFVFSRILRFKVRILTVCPQNSEINVGNLRSILEKL